MPDAFVPNRVGSGGLGEVTESAPIRGLHCFGHETVDRMSAGQPRPVTSWSHGYNYLSYCEQPQG